MRNISWRLSDEGKQTSTDLDRSLVWALWLVEVNDQDSWRACGKGPSDQRKSGKAFVYSALLDAGSEFRLVEDVKDKVCSKGIVQVLETWFRRVTLR